MGAEELQHEHNGMRPPRQNVQRHAWPGQEGRCGNRGRPSYAAAHATDGNDPIAAFAAQPDEVLPDDRQASPAVTDDFIKTSKPRPMGLEHESHENEKQPLRYADTRLRYSTTLDRLAKRRGWRPATLRTFHGARH